MYFDYSKMADSICFLLWIPFYEAEPIFKGKLTYMCMFARVGCFVCKDFAICSIRLLILYINITSKYVSDQDNGEKHIPESRQS